MPDVLIYTSNNRLSAALEPLLAEIGFRYRSVQNAKTALEWFSLREFDILIIDSDIPFNIQQILAGELWKKRIENLLFIINTSKKDKALEMRLSGAEVIEGNNALERLRTILTHYLEERPKKDSDFNILVVDDLESPRDIICIYLEESGFSIKTKGVSSGKEALELLEGEDQPFDCVFTDIKMPRMTGHELIRSIRSKPAIKNIPIIVLTAFGTTDCLLECLTAGASGFLVKPPKKADIAREIGRAKRIVLQGLEARLFKEGEEEAVRDFLQAKGIV
ncbi:MAG: response regulator [Bdellovibrionota bacterium]|jgi:CheY-like chemotaxis protein